MQKIKEEMVGIKNTDDVSVRIAAYYKFLLSAAENKEIFEVIAKKNPFYLNGGIVIHGKEEGTILEMMRKDDRFDEENIKTFMLDGYGMTTQEIKESRLIGRILSQRETEQERDQRIFWERHLRTRNNNQVWLNDQVD